MIEHGDHVKFKTGKVHWMVQEIHNYGGVDSFVLLVSPGTGRRTENWVSNLELVKKGVKNEHGEFGHLTAALPLARRSQS